jgi:hypothetical protein
MTAYLWTRLTQRLVLEGDFNCAAARAMAFTATAMVTERLLPRKAKGSSRMVPTVKVA